MIDTFYYSIRRVLWIYGFEIGDFSYAFFEQFKKEYEASPKNGTLYDMAKYFPKTLDSPLATNVEFILYLQIIFEYLKEQGEDVTELPPRSIVYEFLEPYECIVRHDPSLKEFRRKHRIRAVIKYFFEGLFRLILPLGVCISLFGNNWFPTVIAILVSNVIYMEYLTSENHKF